jgi:hypothetical protein
MCLLPIMVNGFKKNLLLLHTLRYVNIKRDQILIKELKNLPSNVRINISALIHRIKHRSR